MGKWSLEQKITILEEAKNGDVGAVCHKYGVSTATYYNWKKRHDARGVEGLKGLYTEESKNKALKEAEEEIRILRKLLVDRDIELEIQREIVKKKFGTDDLRKI